MVLSPSPMIELSESQKAVLQKYLINGETSWEEVARRVARFVAGAEATPELQRTWEAKFLSILLPMKLVPGGSILANSNHGTHGLLNCFVLSAEDHIKSITKLVSDSVLTTKFRGGVGINIGAEGEKGYIRPKGFPFRDGKALGPCAVLDMVSENSKKITTGNKARRGAFLFSMNWRHPDIWEFIQAKTQSTIDAGITQTIIEQMAQLVLSDIPQSEKQLKLRELESQLAVAWVETHLSPEGKRDRRWHNANISVQLDDEFFRQLDQGEIKANELWDKIAQYAHDTADPGLLLVDNAKRRSPIREFVTCTNPCVTADTWVHTGEGPRQVKDLIGVQHETYINGKLHHTTPEGFFSSSIKEVFLLQTKEGYKLRLTGNHKILKAASLDSLSEPKWVAAEKLKPGDKVMLHDHRNPEELWDGRGTSEEGWLLGQLIGDGEFENDDVAVLQLSESSSETMRAYALDLINETETTYSNSGRVVEVALHENDSHSSALYSSWVAELACSFGIRRNNQQITKQIEQASFEFYRGFLQGLFDASGRIQKSEVKGTRIHLSQNSLPLLESVQRMLLRMGIVSNIRISPEANRFDAQALAVALQASQADSKLSCESELNSRLHSPQANHELLIANHHVLGFKARIGFQHPQKSESLDELVRRSYDGFLLGREPLEGFSATIRSIEPDGIEEVYDCTVPGPARFDANGLVAHNCGEIFLPPNSACNLGSIVLTKFVHRQANGEIEVDWEDLAETVAIATRFLDNVLDVSEFATPDQKHNVRHIFRQLGLGIMGWADYLKLARIPYDSPEHLAEIDRWGGWIAHHAYRTSEAIAAEKGACGVWEQIETVRTGNPFELWVDSEGNHYDGREVVTSERQDLTQVPRRNSTVLSIAPTGSIAQLAACSWAFEPDFGLTVWKQVYVDASRNEQNWVQILNPYLEELDLSDADAEIVKRTGSLKGTEFAQAHPEVAASLKIAREVPPGWHILVQSKWQDWIDSSISKTINLPAHATVEEIKDIYRLAHKAGLKGVTIYRSGTLDSEPIKVGSEEKN